jgi:inner membrane protein
VLDWCRYTLLPSMWLSMAAAEEDSMPSPIGHTLAGCAVALALIPPDMPQGWEGWAWCLISANLADIDFTPGLLVGNPRALHRGPSHSLLGAVVAAALGALLWTWSALPWPTRVELIFLAYGSHVGLDYFTPGRGVLLGWPFSSRRSRAAHPWFLSATVRKTRHHVETRGGRRQFLRAIGREVLLLGPGIILLACARGLSWLPL